MSKEYNAESLRWFPLELILSFILALVIGLQIYQPLALTGVFLKPEHAGLSNTVISLLAFILPVVHILHKKIRRSIVQYSWAIGVIVVSFAIAGLMYGSIGALALSVGMSILSGLFKLFAKH